MQKRISLLREDPKVKEALRQIDSEEKRTLEEQMLLCAIPSPSNQEEKRAAKYLEMFQKLPFDRTWQDEVGNVMGLMKGTGEGPSIMLAAHMDTVFPMEADVTPRVDENGMIHAPGIGDDTRGMAEVLTIARAMLQNGVRPKGDIIFCGDVGEESQGDMRGVRHIFQTMELDGFISIDGSVTEVLHVNGVASAKFKVIYRGTGGHAFRMFGYPNANNAMGRAIARIADIEVPSSPVTTFNVGMAAGGDAESGIPTESWFTVDMRSLDTNELDILKSKVKAAAIRGCEEENRRWNHPTERVTVEVIEHGCRPGGTQKLDSPMVRTVIESYRAFGIEPSIPQAASTDANLPVSLGIPGIAIGRGGSLKYGHTLNEVYDPTGGPEGPKRDVIMLLLLGGYEGICEPELPVRERRNV